VFRRVITARKPSSYPRPQPVGQSNNSDSHGGVPQLIATQPGEENGFSERYLRSAKVAADISQEPKLTPPLPQRVTPPQVVPRPPVTSVTKRFHLSKATSASLTPHSKKRKREVAVFVSEDEVKNAGLDTVMDGGRDSKRVTTASDDPETARPRKRPGVGSATPTVGTPRKTNVAAPDPEMQDALQQYAMEEFGITYGQRAVSKVPKSDDILMTEEGDEAEYTYDTYMRHDTSEDTQSHTGTSRGLASVTSVHGPDSATNSYGILVIPDEQEELFLEVYGEDATSDDEEDWDSEQDDENAENYYAADYPEDEVESDDEYGMGAYQKYRTHGGGSDDEEFGSEDGGDVDEDGIDTVRYPWAEQLRASGRVRRDAEYDKSDHDEDDV